MRWKDEELCAAKAPSFVILGTDEAGTGPQFCDSNQPTISIVLVQLGVAPNDFGIVLALPLPDGRWLLPGETV